MNWKTISGVALIAVLAARVFIPTDNTKTAEPISVVSRAAPSAASFCIDKSGFATLASGGNMDKFDSIVMALAVIEVKHTSVCTDFAAEYNKMMGLVRGTPRYLEFVQNVRRANG